MIELLFDHTWWTFEPSEGGFSPVYHWLNLVEGCFWIVFACLVLARWIRRRSSPIELLYALAFLTFGLSDFREAYALESWLIWFKAINLAAILYLRWGATHPDCALPARASR